MRMVVKCCFVSICVVVFIENFWVLFFCKISFGRIRRIVFFFFREDKMWIDGLFIKVLLGRLFFFCIWIVDVFVRCCRFWVEVGSWGVGWVWFFRYGYRVWVDLEYVMMMRLFVLLCVFSGGCFMNVVGWLWVVGKYFLVVRNMFFVRRRGRFWSDGGDFGVRIFFGSVFLFLFSVVRVRVWGGEGRWCDVNYVRVVMGGLVVCGVWCRKLCGIVRIVFMGRNLDESVRFICM